MGKSTDQHEGERIRAAVSARGSTLAELARHAGVTEQAVQRWVKASKLGAAARETAERGLRKMDIDVSKVWLTALAARGIEVADNAKERRAILDGLSADQLRGVRRLLEGSERDREITLEIIDDRLARK